MEPLQLVPPVVGLLISGYWAMLLRRSPNEWPRTFAHPFWRTRQTRRTWRIVAGLGVAAGLATAAFTLWLALAAG